MRKKYNEYEPRPEFAEYYHALSLRERRYLIEQMNEIRGHGDCRKYLGQVMNGHKKPGPDFARNIAAVTENQFPKGYWRPDFWPDDCVVNIKRSMKERILKRKRTLERRRDRKEQKRLQQVDEVTAHGN